MEKYKMPTCPACKKRFKVLLQDCMIISFHIGGKRYSNAYAEGFCPTCKKKLEELGPRKFLDSFKD